MNVLWICCFYGRAEKVERIIRFFLDQEYTGNHVLLLYNNASYPQTLANIQLPNNKQIILINNHINLLTKQPYTNVGDIFRDALTFAPYNTDVATHADSDDIFLPNHTSEGVKGMIRAHHLLKKAYKPSHSYFLYGKECQLARNNLEPSIFIQFDYLKKAGYNPTSATYNQGWLDKLRNEDLLLDDPGGPPTFLYDWQEGHNTFKISGSGDDGEENFKAHRKFECDGFGDGVLSPISKEEAQKYYDLAKKPINI